MTPIADGHRIDVVDPGTGIGSQEPPRLHAFGLRLVAKLADHWGHSDRRTHVWFELTSRSDAPG